MRGDVFISQSLVAPHLKSDGAQGLIAAGRHIPGSGIDFSEYASGSLEHSVTVESGGETVPVRSCLLRRHGISSAK